jgi:hypothetical protein
MSGANPTFGRRTPAAANVIIDIDVRLGRKVAVKRVVALFGLVVVAGLGAGVRPAYADEASVRLTATGVTAGEHGVSDCADFPPDAPGAGRDGWVFHAPARFGSVRLEFDQDDGRSAVVDLDADRSDASAWAARFFDNGTEFWLSTPAGWTLRSGVAEVAGMSGGGFDLIRTCWGQEPVAAPRRAAAALSAAGAGSATQKIVVVIAPTGTRPPTSTPPTSTPPTSTGSGSPGHAAGPPGHLPKTGEPIAALVAVAVALIVVGAALRRVRRAGA